MNVALGFKAHSGWAALVGVGRDGRALALVERCRIELCDAAWAKAPCHAAEEREPRAADALVKRGIDDARRVSSREVAAAVDRARAARHDVVACAVLMPAPMPAWSTAEILAVHFRMHKAEGVLFPEALCEAIRACGVRVVALPEKTLDTRAVSPAVAALGASAGPPWGKDQKLAATAAILGLRRNGGRAA